MNWPLLRNGKQVLMPDAINGKEPERCDTVSMYVRLSKARRLVLLACPTASGGRHHHPWKIRQLRSY